MPSILVKNNIQKFIDGIKDVNELSNANFDTLMNLISSSGSDSLESVIESHPEYQEFVIRIIDHLFKKAEKLLLKPTELKKDLINELSFNEDKSEIFLKFWVANTKLLLDNCQELKHLDWRLDVELISSEMNKKKNPVGLLQLQTNENDETFTLDHSELLDLYNNLENIQQNLDAFK